MKKNLFISKDNKNQKVLYLLLIGLAIISFIFGILFIFMISDNNVNYIKDNLIDFFSINDSSINLFFKSLFNNYIFIFIIFILGISLIGIPIVLLMYLFKSFILGFSLSSIISCFGFKGLFISLIDLFDNFLFIIILLLLCFYSISFSIKLFKHLFLKVPINFRISIDKYLKILLICLVCSIFISLYDGFISFYLLKLFNI